MARVNMLPLKSGLTRQWDADERDEVIAHHAKLWKKLKKDLRRQHGENGRLKNGRFDQIPGFVNSLQALMDGGYSFTDIGAMFGLSRESIRQHALKFNLERHEGYGAMFRIWNDEQNCFVVVSNEEMGELLRDKDKDKEGRETVKKQRRLQKVMERRQKHIKAIQNYAAEHGQPPTIAKLLMLLGYEGRGNMAVIARFWGKLENDELSYREALDNLYIAAGFPTRRQRKWSIEQN